MAVRVNWRAAVRAVLAAASVSGFVPALGAPTSDASSSGICGRSDRPSVGLALSGGGARGGAHIGALKALEELRVPVDCIAGTSVGAAIGGFYAAGLSVDEIETVARGIDWDAALSNALPRRDRSFRRKQDDYLFLMSLAPGLRGGRVALPIGLNQGQVIDMVVSRVLVEEYAAHDFDRLPIPFRAVATDIANGRAVVLDSGDLALALRASMSLPAVLAPIDIDGRMLVDGGLAMNLPVEVVQSLGAEVVVAIDTASAPLGRESLRSVVDVANQLTTLMTQPALEKQKALLDDNDILLEPVFDTHTTFASFAELATTIDDGYRAVMDDRERLEPWSLDVDRYAAHLAARASRFDVPLIGFVRLDNRSTIRDSIIESRIGRIPLDAPLDPAALEAAVGRVYGLQLFQSVRYAVVRDGTDTAGIEMRVDERAWGPSYLQMGLHYASSSAADTIFSLALSYLRTGINDRGGEWRASLALGDEPEVRADFYQPLGPKGVFFVEPQLGTRSTIYNLFADDHVATSFDVRETAFEIGAGRVFRSAAELRVGVRSAEGDYELRVGDPALLPDDGFRQREAFVRLQADELDSVAFPRAGYSAAIEWRSSRPSPAIEGNVEQVSLHAQGARTWRRQTLLATLRYDATVSGEAPLHRRFRLGGFRDLSGLTRNELSGQNAARVGISWYRRIGSLAMLPAFAGLTLERGNVWDDRRAMSYADSIGAASLWAGVSTPIGPVYLGAGRTNDGRDAVYFALGGAF
jgi:NTE family protein